MKVVQRSTVIFHGVIALLLGLVFGWIGYRLAPAAVLLGLVPVLLVGWLSLRKAVKRLRAVQRKFPDQWRKWLLDQIPFYRKLGQEGRRRFEQDVSIFLAEQRFEGVHGVAVTVDLRLSVAASAAMLLHGRPDWELPSNRTVLFYPGVFDEEYLVEDTEGEFDGMVHGQGPIILSVQAIREDFADWHSGHNVIVHELAHLLDFHAAAADGVPVFLDPASEGAWNELVRREINRVKAGRSILRDYAATSPVEFFAVAVENFFERPGALKRNHSELYSALVAFFNQDMATFMAATENTMTDDRR